VQCSNEIKTWVTIDGKRRNLKNRTLCLKCLPFGSENSLAFTIKRERGVKHARVISATALPECAICGKKRGKSLRICNSCNTKIRRYLAKAKAIRLLGGKCQRCGWQGHQSGYDFHHINPDDKEFSIGQVSNISWRRLEPELAKCELLCRNCHSIEHSNRDSEAFLYEAEIIRSRSVLYQ